MATSTNKKSFLIRLLISLLLMGMVLSINLTLAAQRVLEKKAALPFLKEPVLMEMDTKQIYIAERDAIYIIDRKDYRFVRKIVHKNFSKFRGIRRIDVKTKDIIVTKHRSLYIFDKNTGDLKSKIFDYNNHFILEVISIGGKLVKLYASDDENRIKIDFCNNQLQECKTVFQMDRVCDPNSRLCSFFKTSWGIESTENMLVATFDKDFRILRFDKSGNRLPDIHREDIVPVNIPASFREDFTKRWEKRNQWLILQGYQLEFPDKFPRIVSIRVVDGKIYAPTFQPNDKFMECYVYKLDGTFLEKIQIPLKHSWGDFRNGPVAGNNNVLYNLAQENGKWHLYVSDIQ